MESLLGALAVFGIFIIIIVIAIYVAQAIFLNKFNKLVNGKGTALAWIPVCNVYLLGKLTVNKLVGWILVICVFLTGTYTTTINGVETSHTILPEGISSFVSTVYGLAVFGLFIYAIVKYNQIKKSGNNVMQQPQYTQQPMQQQYAQPVQQPQYTQPSQPQTVQPQMSQQSQVTQQTQSEQPIQQNNQNNNMY